MQRRDYIFNILEREWQPSPKRGTYDDSKLPHSDGKRNIVISDWSGNFSFITHLYSSQLFLMEWIYWKEEDLRKQGDVDYLKLVLFTELRGFDLRTGIITYRQIKAPKRDVDSTNKISKGGLDQPAMNDLRTVQLLLASSFLQNQNKETLSL